MEFEVTVLTLARLLLWLQQSSVIALTLGTFSGVKMNIHSARPQSVCVSLSPLLFTICSLINGLHYEISKQMEEFLEVERQFLFKWCMYFCQGILVICSVQDDSTEQPEKDIVTDYQTFWFVYCQIQELRHYILYKAKGMKWTIIK